LKKSLLKKENATGESKKGIYTDNFYEANYQKWGGGEKTGEVGKTGQRASVFKK